LRQALDASRWSPTADLLQPLGKTTDRAPNSCGDEPQRLNAGICFLMRA